MKPTNAPRLLAVAAFSIGELNAQSDWFWESPMPQENSVHGVSFINANTATAVGEYGTILRTTNGGLNWTSKSTGTTNELWGVPFTFPGARKPKKPIAYLLLREISPSLQV